MRDERTALVVEDDPGMCGLLEMWLKEAGYLAVTASTSGEAIRLVRNAPPAVAFCDVGLPDRDGLWLAGEIRAHSPRTAIILATGRRDAAVRAAVDQLLVLECLLKPFDARRLRTALERARGWRRQAERRSAGGRDHERRSAIRYVIAGERALPLCRLQSGHQLLVQNISTGGALVTSHIQLFPQSELSLLLQDAEGLKSMRARVVRCDVAELATSRVIYRAALQFHSDQAARRS